MATLKSTYRNLFRIDGVKGFSAAAFLGRLPAGMMTLAIILAIIMLMGSYAVAGIVAAATMLGMALCAPFTGRLVDSFGQSRVLLISMLFNLLGTISLILSIKFIASIFIMCCAGFIAGASRLSTGTLARSRWAYVIQQLDFEQREGKLHSAYTFESIVDEVVFVSAPLLVTYLCTQFNVLSGLIACLVTYLLGALLLSVQLKTQPPAHPDQPKNIFTLGATPGLMSIALAILFIGISAGSIEVIVVARATQLDLRNFIGTFMAILAIASMMAGFWYGTQRFKYSEYKLWVYCLGGLAYALIPFVFSSYLAVLIMSLFIAGLLIGPTSIAGQLFVKKILPDRMLNEGMSIMVTAMISGMAIGSWLAGLFIQYVGLFSASLLPVSTVFVSFIVARYFCEEVY